MLDKKIKITTKRGFVLNVIEGDTITQAIQSKGEYDTNTLNSFVDILELIRPGTSLDVGANVGNHAVLIAQLSKLTIAFEPVSFVYDLLKSNLEQNSLNNADAVNRGLSIKSSNRNIFVPKLNLGCSSLEVQVGEGEIIQIQTVVGDQFMQEYYPDKVVDFIKMDVEGHEAEALLGLENTINLHQPLLLIEWKNSHTLSAFKEQNLWVRLFASYHFYVLTHNDNKKLYTRNLMGFFRRLYVKLFKRKWCLSNFDSAKSYSNVYLVPTRYADLFKQFQYKPSIRN